MLNLDADEEREWPKEKDPEKFKKMFDEGVQILLHSKIGHAEPGSGMTEPSSPLHFLLHPASERYPKSDSEFVSESGECPAKKARKT